MGWFHDDVVAWSVTMLRFTISPPAAPAGEVVELPRWLAHPSAVPSSSSLPSSSSKPSWAALRLQHRPWAVTVGLRAGERVAGLGATNRGQADRRGQSFRGVNLDTIFYGIPGGTYGSFPLAWMVDPSAPGTVRAVAVLSARPLDVTVDADGAVGELRFVDVDPAWEGAVDVLAFEGSPSEVSAEIRSVFGAACVPPPWAFGFHQSRWSYRTANDVKEVVEGARAADVPLDVVHLDIHMMDAYQVFTWHPDRFPDPAGLHRWLDARGVRTMAIVDPGVSTANDLAQRLEAADGLLTTSTGKPYHGKVWPGTTVFPDFGLQTVRETWRDAHKALTDVGVSAIWNDMNDPVFKVGVVHDPLAEDVWHAADVAADVAADDGVDVPENRRVPHIEKRNLYANEMATATQAALQRTSPTTRPFVLSRSGFLGIQQHAALWTGDNFSSWEQLEENLHMVMHLGLVGVPISGADIGGFGGRRGKYGIAKWRPPAELFVRWLELGALMPFCRVHSVLYGPRQEPWAFGGDVPRLARDILRRRMALLPTLLALAHAASTTGTPLVRPLWFHGPVPAASSTAADTSFMLGDDLLVAPVTRKGADARTIYLPAGRWRHFLTGEVYGTRDDGVQNGVGEGGGEGVSVDVTAPLGQTPIFVRGTTPLVLASGGSRVAEALAGPVILEVLSPLSASEKEPAQPQAQEARRGRSRVVIADGEGPTWLEVEAIHDDGDIVVHLSIEGVVPTERGLVWRLPPGFTTLRTPSGEDVSLETERVAADGRVAVCATSTTALVPGRYLAR